MGIFPSEHRAGKISSSLRQYRAYQDSAFSQKWIFPFPAHCFQMGSLHSGFWPLSRNGMGLLQILDYPGSGNLKMSKRVKNWTAYDLTRCLSPTKNIKTVAAQPRRRKYEFYLQLYSTESGDISIHGFEQFSYPLQVQVFPLLKWRDWTNPRVSKLWDLQNTSAFSWLS